jgi:hypothetical protein
MIGMQYRMQLLLSEVIQNKIKWNTSSHARINVNKSTQVQHCESLYYNLTGASLQLERLDPVT